jgi:hypothetical protein
MSMPFSVNGGIVGGVGSFVVSKGFVNGVEPTINGVPISGEQGKPPPEVVGKVEFDRYKRCYVCLKMVVDDEGKADGSNYASIVISKGIRKDHKLGPEAWLHPLAVIAQCEAGYIIYQNVHFNLIHWVGPGGGGSVSAASGYHHYFSSI